MLALWPLHCSVEGAAALIDVVLEECQEDFGDFTRLDHGSLGFFCTDEAAGICGLGTICCHSSRGRSQAFGLQVTAEQICG